MALISQTFSSPNYSRRDGAAISLIVLHATVGGLQSSLNWLISPQSRVSAHYVISKTGRVYQLVQDSNAAWHAGKSHWLGRDGDAIQKQSLGIELENANTGRDPYPPAQIDACLDLCAALVARYAIARANVARHADIAIPLGRKTDPAGFPWAAFVDRLYAPASPTPARVASDSLLLWEPRATPAQCVAWLTRGKTGEYTKADVQAIVKLYYQHATGIDPLLAIAQMAHETGSLSSYWAARPRRNPAGLGVSGVKGAGLLFASWADAVPAHVGRLLAYALPADTGTEAQQACVRAALALRPLPILYRGAAARLGGLDGRWAVPGVGYSQRIAEIANAIAGVQA